MHPEERVREALRLGQAGHTATGVSRLLGVPRSTVREWLSGSVPHCAAPAGSEGPACARCQGPEHDFPALPGEYLYLLGVYLGDGCISANRLSPRAGGYEGSSQGSHAEVTCYSRSWPCLLPQHGPGRKHEREIALLEWQRLLLEEHPEQPLRGLIHSDGCRFMNTGRSWRYPRYSFSNASADIRRIFCDACDALGLHWTTAPRTVYVSRMADVARLDGFVGPKA